MTTNQCVTISGACTKNEDCPCDGGICQYCDTNTNRCEPGCASDTECPQVDGGGYIQCLERRCVPTTCQAHTGCPNGFCCASDSSCRQGCRNDQECTNGTCDQATCKCLDWECVSDTDCDTDGGVPDGGLANTYCNPDSHACAAGCRAGGCGNRNCNLQTRQCECADDALEGRADGDGGVDGGLSVIENDSCGNATAVQAGTIDQLVLCRSGAYPYEEDYYIFTLDQKKHLTVTATYTHTTENDLQLDLFKGNCQASPVARSQESTGTETVDLLFAEAGDYIIKVYRQVGIQGEDIPYSLTIALADAPQTCQNDTYDESGLGNARTENDAIPVIFGSRSSPQEWTATSLSICAESDGQAADVDWYKLALEINDRVEITLDGNDDHDNIDMVLHLPDGSSTIFGTPGAKSMDETIDYTVTQKGIHYLEVKGAVGVNSNWPYTLTVKPHLVWICELDPHDAPDGGNGSLSQAVNIAPSPNICSLNTYDFPNMTLCKGLGDDADYYKVKVNRGDKLQLSATVPTDGGIDAASDVDVGIWCDGDDANPPPYNWTESATQSNPESVFNKSLQCFAPQDGWCYMRVMPNSAQTSTAYNMNVNHWAQPQCSPDEYEAGAGNNTTGEAALIAGPYPRTLTNMSSCLADDDWYKFNVQEGDSITVSLAHDKNCKQLWLTLYDPNDTPIKWMYTGDALTVNADNAQSGTWKVAVESQDACLSANYNITFDVKFVPNCTCTDPNESNNTQGTATFTSYIPREWDNPCICPTDEDWYKFTLTGTSTIVVGMCYSYTEGPLRLYLYKGTERRCIVRSTGAPADPDDPVFIWKDAEAGTYYVQIKGYNGVEENPYDLKISNTEDDRFYCDFTSPNTFTCPNWPL